MTLTDRAPLAMVANTMADEVWLLGSGASEDVTGDTGLTSTGKSRGDASSKRIRLSRTSKAVAHWI